MGRTAVHVSVHLRDDSKMELRESDGHWWVEIDWPGPGVTIHLTPESASRLAELMRIADFDMNPVKVRDDVCDMANGPVVGGE